MSGEILATLLRKKASGPSPSDSPRIGTTRKKGSPENVPHTSSSQRQHIVSGGGPISQKSRVLSLGNITSLLSGFSFGSKSGKTVGAEIEQPEIDLNAQSSEHEDIASLKGFKSESGGMVLETSLTTRGSSSSAGSSGGTSSAAATSSGAEADFFEEGSSVVTIASDSVATERVSMAVEGSLLQKKLSCSTGDSGLSQQPILSKTLATFDGTAFAPIGLLGQGSFGTVIHAEYSPTKVVYAIKKIAKASVGERQLRHVMNEKSLLSDLDSPFVIKLHGTTQTRDDLMFVFEVVECGELWGAIYDPSDRMPHELSLFYASCLVLALEHIHSRGIVFRDLKPENVMIDRLGYPRVVDFGLAKRVVNGEMLKTLCGTPEYVAPEVLLDDAGHSFPVDLWALGCVIYEMIMRRTPFVGKEAGDMMQLFTNIAHVQRRGIVLSSKIDERAGKTIHCRNLLTQLFAGDPTKRLTGPTTRSLLQHPYFQQAAYTEEELSRRAVQAPQLQPVVHSGSGKIKGPVAQTAEEASKAATIGSTSSTSTDTKTVISEAFTGSQELFANF